jgi:hypothetical protein
VIAVSPSLISKESYPAKRPKETRAVKAALLRKRKRKVAGPKVAPLIAMPTVAFLSDTEWQPFLQLLPARPQPELLRSELDQLMIIYLGILEAEADSPSAREVATVLENVARRAHQLAQDLHRLDIRGDEAAGPFNTANEAAADILANIPIRPENRSVLDAALRANEVLAAVAVREAKKLAESSKKGRPIRGAATGWMLRQLAELLHDNGLPVSLPPKAGDPLYILSQHFLQAARTRAETLREPDWARKEIQSMLMLSKQVFVEPLGHEVRGEHGHPGCCTSSIWDQNPRGLKLFSEKYPQQV